MPRRVGVRGLLLAANAVAISGCSSYDGTDGSDETMSRAAEPIYVIANTPLFNDTFVADVCFLTPGWANERITVRQAIEQSLEAESGLDFVGFGDCVGDPNAIAIEFREAGSTGGYGAYGKGGRVGDNPDAQVVLALDPNRGFIRTLTVHEIGHAVGFIHEHDRPDRDPNNLCNIDPAGGVSPGHLIETPYDLDSIMNYCRDWDHNGNDDYTQGDDFWQLSPLDAVGVKILYGVPPTQHTMDAAFVSTDQINGEITLAQAKSWNFMGATNAVTWLGTGDYEVTLPRIGGQPGGNVQVTAVGGNNRCKVGNWTHSGSDVIARVACHAPNGNPADSKFSMAYLIRRDQPGVEGGYAFAHDPFSSSPSATYSWSSNGQGISILRSSAGRYQVTFAGQNIAGGTVQVTAFGFGSEYCKVVSWNSTRVEVSCHSAGGAAADTAYALSFTHGSPNGSPSFAYAWADQPSTPNVYVPSPFYQRTIQRHPVGGSDGIGGVLIQRQMLGKYRVTYSGMLFDPALGYGRANVQATAYGLNANYCTVDSFGGSTSFGQADVSCYASSGVLTDSFFTTTFSSLQTVNEPRILADSASGNPTARGMSVDPGSWVYYAEGGASGLVRKVNVNGGVKDRFTPGPDKQVTLASALNQPSSLAANSTHVFWTTSSSVQRVSKNGGSPTTIWTGTMGTAPRNLAVNGSHVFFTTNTGRILRVPVNGGSATTLAMFQSDPFGIAIDGSNVFWTNRNGGQVRRVSINGGTSSTLANGLPRPTDIAIDTDSVYWLSSDDGSLRKIPKVAGAMTTLATGQPNPQGIALDSQFIYWADSQAGAVKRVSRTGGAVVTLSSSQLQPRVGGIDGDGVFFSTTDQNVKKVRKIF